MSNTQLSGRQVLPKQDLKGENVEVLMKVLHKSSDLNLQVTAL
jgi:hypothetical protein